MVVKSPSSYICHFQFHSGSIRNSHIHVFNSKTPTSTKSSSQVLNVAMVLELYNMVYVINMQCLKAYHWSCSPRGIEQYCS
ncbi:hypothetical protein ACS0TY_005641 [Phlomoides rotata]